MSISQQRILIVGGSSGMGLACAQRLGSLGARTTIVGRSQSRLDDAMKQIKGSVAAHVADITDAASVSALFEKFGQIDHLVLAASSNAAWGLFSSTSADALRQALESKLIGYWRTLGKALPQLRKDGSVVMLTGAAARTAMPGTAGLAAVNGAITQMAMTLVKELAPLRINVVSPGLVDTPAYDHLPREVKAGMFAGAAKSLPVARTGVASDIASAVELLIANTFITGALIDVDGGARMAI